MPHWDVRQLRKQGIRSFPQLPRFVASRARAGDDVVRRCFWMAEIHVCASQTWLHRRARSTEDVSWLFFARHVVNCCHRLSSFQPVSGLTYARHDASSHTDWHLLIPSSLHVQVAARTPLLHLSRKLWQSRHELPSCCHQMLRHDAPAPKRTTNSHHGVHPRMDLWLSDFCCNSVSCLSE